MRGVMRAWYEVEAGQSAVTGTMVRAPSGFMFSATLGRVN